jgi:hypothetical protein
MLLDYVFGGFIYLFFKISVQFLRFVLGTLLERRKPHLSVCGSPLPSSASLGRKKRTRLLSPAASPLRRPNPRQEPRRWEGEQRAAMDDYAREMMELKTLVTRTLEKKGVLAKIRVGLSPSHFSSFPGPDFPFHPFHMDRGQYRAVAAPWI